MSAGDASLGGAYPIALHLEPQRGERNRETTAFRLLLALPHLLLVGGPFFGVSLLGGRLRGIFFWWGGGALGSAAFACAVVSWFAIVFWDRQPRGLWDLAYLYLRWFAQAAAYFALLRDEYPPFGGGEYPVRVDAAYPEGERDKPSVALRFLYVIPHAIVLVFLQTAWLVATAICWISIVLRGSAPEGLLEFGAGVLGWTTRVLGYGLLMTDEYPPFQLQ